MDEMRFQNKVVLTQDEFETWQLVLPTFNFHNKINWYSFSLKGRGAFSLLF
jgi:hypothetical protein